MIREVGTAEAIRMAADGRRIIDVREPVEWNQGHIAGATLLPLADLVTQIDEVVPDRSTPLLLHCLSGARSARGAKRLAELGYADIVNLKAHLAEWQALGGPWETPERLLSDAQLRRYSRQVLIPEVGEEGQRRLLDSRVLLIGAGGLGSPVALYLAASGVGTLGIVDDDAVDESNLQRQVLHGTDRVGVPKVDSAEMTLRGLNPDVRVEKHRERLADANVDRLVAAYDVVVDGTDNFETRYLLNDAALRHRKPVVHGSIYRWDGQVTTFVPYVGPCYRCMYPTQPPAELAPDCEVAGVLGVLPGIVGMLQANEVFKLLLGVGEPLAGRLLMLDAATTEFHEVRVWRDPECPACGERAGLRKRAAPEGLPAATEAAVRTPTSV